MTTKNNYDNHYDNYYDYDYHYNKEDKNDEDKNDEEENNKINSIIENYKGVKITNKNKLYIVTCYDSKQFKTYSIVKYITCSNSGKCYLVEEIKSKNREWLMYYDIYPIESNIHNYSYKWFRNIKTENIINKIMSSISS